MTDLEKRSRNRGAILAAFGVVLFLIWLDQWSKAAVFRWFAEGTPELVRDPHGHLRYLVAGEWLSLMTSCNPGAAFGRLGGIPRVLVGGRILAVLVLAIFLWRHDTRHRLVFVAMVLVLAGAAGNVVDNLWTGCDSAGVHHGVRDFIDVWFEPLFGWDYHFPSFNVADSCISVGAVLWVLAGFLGGGSREEAAPETALDEGEGSVS
ncbi:MAG TPA: signal peptidase II [Planctomycetes bacterium]|nr:signal peptidase II [Planctomycetota bacterium]